MGRVLTQNKEIPNSPRNYFRRFYEFFFKRLRGRGFGLGIFNAIHSTLWAKTLKPDFVEINGMRFYLSQEDAALSDTLAVDRKWEPQTTAQFQTRLKPAMTVIDAGANIGYFTVLAAKLVGPHGRVFAFEPEVKNIALLEKNIRANDCKNVTICPYAIAASLHYAPLYLATNSTGHSLLNNQRESFKSTPIVTVGLDDFFGDNFYPDLIKMDIEGGEWDALKGMEKLLSQKTLKTFIFEWNESPKNSQEVSLEKISSKLASFGFELAPRLDESNYLAFRRD